MSFQPWHVALLCALLCAPVAAHAQGNSDSTQAADSTIGSVGKPEVVVSATRWEEPSSTVCREIVTVTPRDVQLRNPSTTADMLGQTGRVFVQKSQLGGGSPMMRGYGANAVMLMVDGIRMNNAIYRGGNLQNSITIDANALDGAEVLFGPGSLQYGSDALGGSMVFTTRQPTFSPDATTLHGTAMLRYGTAMMEKTGSVAIDVGGSALASATVITYTDFDDLRGGAVFNADYPDYGRRPWYVERINDRDSMVTNANDVLQTPTGYNQLNITENLAWKASDLLTLKYGGIFTTSSDIPRYDRLQEKIDTLPRFAEWYYGPQFWTMHSLTASLSDAGFLGDAARITASFQYYNESRNDRRFNNASKRNQDETVVIGAINADMRVHLGGDQFTNDMATATSSSHLERELYYGIEAYFNDVTSEATRTNILTNVVTPTQTRYPDGGSMITSGAAYAQVRWATSEALTLAGGLRFTYYDLQSTLKDTATLSLPFTDLSMSTSAITGSVGATWRVAPSLTVHANMSSGFRAPNLDDVAKVFESAPGKLVVPNPELGPEYAYTLEGGFTWSAAQWLRAEINAFRTWSIDAVQQRPFTLNGKDTVYIDGTPWAVVANQNVGQANIYGASAEVNASIGQLEACATGVYAYGTVADTNLPLGKMPPVYGSVRATWHQDAFMFGAQFWWMATKPFGEIPADGERVIGINTTPDGNPAWQRVDLSAGWRPSSMFEIRAILENLLDAQYRPYSSGVSAPGRNLVVSVRANM